MIDWLLESDEVVVARNRPSDPFSFSITESLWGQSGSVPISNLVDSTTRRRLERDPEGGVVFAFDTASFRWKSLGYAHAELREVVERVLANREEWGEGFHPERFALAEALHDHPDPRLRDLALAELDRAPYAMLRTLNLRIGVREMLRVMWRPEEYPYLPIRILLMGLTGEPAARAEIQRLVGASAEGSEAAMLGAYATALVELEGPAGVDRLVDLFLSAGRQTSAKVESVVEALAIQNGSGPPPLQDHISLVLAKAARANPEIAGPIARQFGNRSDWSQAEHLKTLLKEKRLASTTSVFGVAAYVAMAEQPAPAIPASQSGHAPVLDIRKRR